MRQLFLCRKSGALLKKNKKILFSLLTNKEKLCILYISYMNSIHREEKTPVDIIISNSSDTPIYLQIAEAIRYSIISGGLKEGDVLPSIRSLAKELSVSVITTKKAYEVLEGQGYIKTHQGRGSVVSARSASLAREHRLSELEQHLLEAADIARELNISAEEFAETARRLYDIE